MTKQEAALNAQAPKKPDPPAYRRPIRDIIEDLSRPIAEKHLKQKQKGKGQAAIFLDFIPWYHAIKYLDWFAPGWGYQIHSVTPLNSQCVITVSITIPAAEGDITRFATGIEDEETSSYGDTSSNAESMALRRAASKFGLGLYLYDRK
jgi:hypothetical protein